MRNFLLLALTLLVFLPTVGSAEEDANAILQRVDDVATSSKDFKARISLETTDASGEKTARELEVWQKGREKRMLKLTAPARLKGVGILSTDSDQLYMYLPSFGRVRRVAGRKRGESFLGSNFTQDDMVRTGYAKRFTARLEKADDKTWTLHLDPRKVDDEPYHHLRIVVRKVDHVVAKVEYFENEQKVARTLVASEIRAAGKTPLAHHVEVTDHDDKSVSVAILSGVEVDTGIEDSFFTKRHLKRKH